jgi:hypothetical protein
VCRLSGHSGLLGDASGGLRLLRSSACVCVLQLRQLSGCMFASLPPGAEAQRQQEAQLAAAAPAAPPAALQPKYPVDPRLSERGARSTSARTGLIPVRLLPVCVQHDIEARL